MNILKPKVLKSKQVGVDAFEVQCDCGSEFDTCFEGSYGSSWSQEDKAIFECEGCGQKWKLPKDVELVIKFKRRNQ